MISYSSASLYSSDSHTCFFLTVLCKMTTFLDLLEEKQNAICPTENVLGKPIFFCILAEGSMRYEIKILCDLTVAYNVDILNRFYYNVYYYMKRITKSTIEISRVDVRKNYK